MAMKTPGVYVVEKNAFPNSVVEVATAVPAFIGYTEFALNGGASLDHRPWRISSLAEYERYFGGAPRPRFTIKIVDPELAGKAAGLRTAAETARSNAAAEIAELLRPKTEELARAETDLASARSELAAKPEDPALQASLRQKTQALEVAKAAKAAAERRATPVAAAKAALQREMEAVKEAQARLDVATLALPPAEAGKPPPVAEAEQKELEAALARRSEATKRLAGSVAAANALSLALAAVDAEPGPPDATREPGQATVFTQGRKRYLLSRGAGKSGGRFLMHQAMRHFFQNGGGPCYVVSVGTYDKTEAIAAGDASSGLLSGLAPLMKEQEPTMVLVPDAVLLKRSECGLVQTEVLKHCGYEMRNRVAILDVWAGDRDRRDGCIDAFRNDIGINFLNYAAAYYPWLETSLVQAGELDYGIFANADELAALLRDAAGLNETVADEADNNTRQLLGAFEDLSNDETDWRAKLRSDIDASPKSAADKKNALARLADPAQLKVDIQPHRQLLHKTLLRTGDLFPAFMEEAQRQLNLMPPSAAMAGLYTMVDNTRGVWKAPANVSVAGVVKPAVEISHADQEDLNVTTQGKSINAIRSFIGEGALVWGARTLDGNSLDWRYINVRRTMIMLEESCKLAAKAMVFEPNVANTWVTIKSMIANFLTGIWKRGGLAGAVPDDAFSVHVGLGETMTPEDILEGILRVTVLVALSRPAEFIEITFQQQMQKS